jgi:hypothetical protein
LLLLFALVGSGGFAGVATAGVIWCCGATNSALPPFDYIHTCFSYTDLSRWDGSQAYTAERQTVIETRTYIHDMPNGGFHDFDNGTTSPYRRTSLHNWSLTSDVFVRQLDQNGNC